MSVINMMNKLPDDVAKHMLSFSEPTDLDRNISKTSKSLHRFSNDPILWKKIAGALGIKIEEGRSLKNAVLVHVITHSDELPCGNPAFQKANAECRPLGRLI
jgi:hypothetical protein